MKKYTLPTLTLILSLVVWELYVRLFHISLYILPSPFAILEAIIQNFSELWMHSMTTLTEAMIGLVLATILGVFIGIGMDLSKTFKYSIFPHLVVTQTVPVMILGPLFSIWFGFGMTPKILMVIFMCFFPIVISFSDALSEVDQKQVNLLRSYGASPLKVYWMVKIPAAASALFSGLKVAATYCIGGAIVGEWLNASAGLGYYMLRAKNGYMLDKVFACVVVIILWSLALNGCVNVIEKLLFPHTKKKRGMRQ